MLSLKSVLVEFSGILHGYFTITASYTSVLDGKQPGRPCITYRHLTRPKAGSLNSPVRRVVGHAQMNAPSFKPPLLLHSLY